MKLRPFDDDDAPDIVSWVTSLEEAQAWCAHPGPELPRPNVFRSWHTDPETHPWVLVHDAQRVGYGEIWVDVEEQEIELARLLVAPEQRGKGVGREMIAQLLLRAQSFDLPRAYIRVLPNNRAAIACYGRAGFVRVTVQDERSFNAEQPVNYVWMSRDFTAAS